MDICVQRYQCSINIPFFFSFFQWNAALHSPVSTRLASRDHFSCKVILVGWGGWRREFLPFSDGMSGYRRAILWLMAVVLIKQGNQVECFQFCLFFF